MGFFGVEVYNSYEKIFVPQKFLWHLKYIIVITRFITELSMVSETCNSFKKDFVSQNILISGVCHCFWLAV